jgi:endo-1,4-beta-D-glucanase Y
MKRYLILCLLSYSILTSLAGAACAPSKAAGAAYPFPQHLTYAPGTIRPNHRTQAQQDEDVRAFYDYWKASYLKAAGQTGAGYPLYRVSFGSRDPDRTVSEGQGYGMIIVALMAGYEPEAQKIFDGLWEFSRKYPSKSDSRLMGWQVPPDPGGSDSAFDGDADIAYGLLLADRQWGSQGRINYRAEAKEVIAGIYESTIGPDSHLPMLGDWTSPKGGQYNQYTPRSSDFMPANFRAYGRATPNLAWAEVISSSQAAISSLQARHSPTTGLLPDFIEPASPSNHTPQPADPNFLEGPNDGAYYYNAGRVPWRLGTDALLNNDPVSLAQTRKISAWAKRVTGGLPTNIKPGYYLDGKPIPPGNYFTTFFVAPLGVAAMTKPDQQAWLNALYDAVYNTHQDYYEDSVTLLCLLIMTGNYWDPTLLPE